MSASSTINYNFPTGYHTLEQKLVNNQISGVFYDRTNRLAPDVWKLAKVLPGNLINLGFKSGNTFRGLVQDVIKFKPSSLEVENEERVISIGSKVELSEQGETREKVIKGNYYVVAGNKTNEGLKDIVISDGFKNINVKEGQNLKFVKQFPLLTTEDGRTVFPIEESFTTLEAGSGAVATMEKSMFLDKFNDTIEEIIKVTGLSPEYVMGSISPKNAQNIGVVVMTPIELINNSKNINKELKKEEVQSILSIFAGKLNTIFGKDFVHIIGDEDTTFVNGETEHPAFIHEGQIYINLDHPGIHPGTIVHELAHLILGSLKVTSPETYQKAIDTIDLSQRDYDNYKVKYKNRLQSDLKEEILADLFSSYFEG
ncbi:MAG: hypothetical protein Nk1A_8200 [Endomicrobiia bacterium]|nr:MAG: hypothetical protein Nk1A_8200 [Endomicrobiia bacterium]